jgi:hypothetical protein
MKHLFRALLVAGALCTATPSLAQRFQGDDAPPAPPSGASPNQMIPPRDGDGSYLTPNRHLIPEETAWHVRAALNVAALGCRDAYEAQTVALYNAMLREQRDVFAHADIVVRADYHARYGAGWQDRHDDAMTRVYNFFAQPPAQSAFCAVARAVLAEAATVDPEHFLTFAADALPRLEAPFTDFYRAYDAYRVALADWRAHGPTRQIAAVERPSAIPASFEP